MNMVAVHAFASMIGKEGGMYVYDLVPECLDERLGHLPKEAGQNNQRRFVLVDLTDEQGFVEAVPVYDEKGYVFLFCDI